MSALDGMFTKRNVPADQFTLYKTVPKDNPDPMSCGDFVKYELKILFSALGSGESSITLNNSMGLRTVQFNNFHNTGYNNVVQIGSAPETYIYIPQTKQIRHKTQNLVWMVSGEGFDWTVAGYVPSCFETKDPPSCPPPFQGIVNVNTYAGSGQCERPYYRWRCNGYFLYLVPPRKDLIGQKFDIQTDGKIVCLNVYDILKWPGVGGGYDSKFYLEISYPYIRAVPDKGSLFAYNISATAPHKDPLISMDFSVEKQVACVFDKSLIDQWTSLTIFENNNFDTWTTPEARLNDPKYQDVVDKLCKTVTNKPLYKEQCKSVCTKTKKCEGIRNYCLANMTVPELQDSQLYADCRDHIRNNEYSQNQLNNSLRVLFNSKCESFLNSIKDKKFANLTEDEKAQFEKCSCYPTDEILNKYKENMRRELNTEAAELLIRGDLQCWYPPCSRSNVSYPPDRNGTCPDANIQICLNKVNIDNQGSISTLNMEQNNQCKQYMEKSKNVNATNPYTPDSNTNVSNICTSDSQCSQHGKCVNNACVCENGYSGPYCATTEKATDDNPTLAKSTTNSDETSKASNASKLAQDSNASNNNNNTGNPSKNLTTGQIVAIAIGGLIFLICIGGFIWWLKNKNSDTATPSTLPTPA